MTERAVCHYCGKRYKLGGATRQVDGAPGRFACGWCVRWTDRDPYDPLTEARILDSAVSRLVGRRTTLRGASALVDIKPFYALEDAEPSSRRWAFIDRDRLIADFDKAYPPARFSGRVVWAEGRRQPPTFVPGPPVAPQRSPRRPPTEAEQRRDAIEAKRDLAARQERRRQGRIRRIRNEVAKQAKAIAKLEAQ